MSAPACLDSADPIAHYGIVCARCKGAGIIVACLNDDMGEPYGEWRPCEPCGSRGCVCRDCGAPVPVAAVR